MVADDSLEELEEVIKLGVVGALEVRSQYPIGGIGVSKWS
jgi:hypothetical protein